MGMMLYVIHGLSQAGKTRISEYLQVNGAVELHPIASWKRLHEQIYGLPIGALDNEIGKSFVPEGMNMTMNDFMVKLYFFMRDVDPYYSSRSLRVLLRQHNNAGTPAVIVLSLRNQAEVETIIDFIKEVENVVYIHVTRDSSKMLASDELHDEIHDQLCQHLNCIEVVNNYSSIEELHKYLNNLLR
jgi:hypothetical protein